MPLSSVFLVARTGLERTVSVFGGCIEAPHRGLAPCVELLCTFFVL
uniref:Uncharacterized protein n=1 Tax=Arundo donax TaxID=35708 RepID=A0A0A9FW91_ARUDO